MDVDSYNIYFERNTELPNRTIMELESYYAFGDCLNMTYEEAESMLFYSKGMTFYTQVILPFLFLLGVLDNAAFVYVVARQSSMKTATNRYLVNLAIADIVFLVSAIGEKLWKFANSPIADDDTPIGRVGCILLPFLGDTAYFASLFFVTLVSAEIFFAVCYPKGKSMFQHRTWSLWLTILSWVLSGITAGFIAPANSGADYYCLSWSEAESMRSLPSKFTICGTTLRWLRTVVHVMQMVPFFATFFLNGFLYIKIVIGLNRSIIRLRSHTSVKRDGDTHLRNQIARMLVVNGVVFFVLLAPFETQSLLEAFDVHVKISQEVSFSTITRGLMYLNSVVNPIIYTAMSQRYREAFKNAFNPTPKCRLLGSLPNRGGQASSTQTYFKMSQTTTKI